MAKERWRAVLGFEGFYEVSDRGRVRRLTNTRGNRRDRPMILKGAVDRRGRRHSTLSKPGCRTTTRVARLVLLAFVGPCPDGMEACHANDKPEDNRLSNLRWDTHAANVREAQRNGLLWTTQKGERHHLARLKRRDVVKIVAALKRGVSGASLARRFGVTSAAISDIKTGKTWKDVPR